MSCAGINQWWCDLVSHARSVPREASTLPRGSFKSTVPRAELPLAQLFVQFPYLPPVLLPPLLPAVDQAVEAGYKQAIADERKLDLASDLIT